MVIAGYSYSWFIIKQLYYQQSSSTGKGPQANHGFHGHSWHATLPSVQDQTIQGSKPQLQKAPAGCCNCFTFLMFFSTEVRIQPAWSTVDD